MSHKPFLKAKGYQQPAKHHGYVPSPQVQYIGFLVDRAEQRMIARCDYWWQYDHNVYPRETLPQPTVAQMLARGVDARLGEAQGRAAARIGAAA